MMDKKLKEGLDLIGGKALVKDGDQYYVLITLKEFKKMKQEGIGGLTKQELVDRINNDIVAWKSAQEEDSIGKINLEEMAKQGIADEIRYEKAA